MLDCDVRHSRIECLSIQTFIGILMPSSDFIADIRQRFEIIDHNRDSAPLVSLGQARIAAEAIAKQIYIAELERQGNQTLLRHKENISKMMLGASGLHF